MKKGFFKKAWLVLEYLIENWEIIYPLVDEIVQEIKSKNYSPSKTTKL